MFKIADWLCKARELQPSIENHPTLVIAESIYSMLFCYHSAVVKFYYTVPLRNGSRYVYTWVGVYLLAFFTESMKFVDGSINVVFHSQTILTFMGMRTPLYLLCGIYHTLFYTSYVIVKRIRLQWWGEAAANGLVVLLLSLPLQIMGTKLLWWQWYDGDPRLISTFYAVPLVVLAWYAMLALLALCLATLQYAIFFHVLHEIFRIHSAFSLALLLIIYLAASLKALLSSRMKYDLYNTVRKDLLVEVRLNGKQIHVLAELSGIVAIHFLFHMLLAVFGSSENIVSEGIYQAIGSCNEVEQIFSPFGFIPQKYFCIEQQQQKLFDFHCILDGQLPRVVDNEPLEYYAICGTSFENRIEYIAFIWIYCVMVLFVINYATFSCVIKQTLDNIQIRYRSNMLNSGNKKSRLPYLLILLDSMLPDITRAQLCSKSGAVLFDKYRARLLNASDVPVLNSMSWMIGKEIVIIDRFSESDHKDSLSTDEEKDDILPEFKDQVQDYEKQSSLNNSRRSTSPLKYEFLTLSKLQTKNAPKISIDKYYSFAMKQFLFSSLKTSEARSLAGKFITNGIPFDMEMIQDAVIWIPCDMSDYFHTCMLGLWKTCDGVATYHVRTFPRNYKNTIKFLEDYMEHFYDSYKASPEITYCVYDVVPKMTDRDNQNRVSGFVEFHVSWKSSNMSHCSDGILSKPAPSASVVAEISPGWLDLRLPHLGLADELELMLILARALRTGEVTWRKVDFDRMHEDEKLMKSALQSLLNQNSTFSRSMGFLFVDKNLEESVVLDIPHDFTEELWLILRYCHSNQSLTKALKYVFSALQAGYKNTSVPANNRCTMARLLRDACANDLLLPRLEGLTPLQIYLEMGLEQLRRACMDEFLSREYFGSVAEIDAVFDCCTKKEPQDQADTLFLFYNSLLVINTCKQYLRLDRHHINIIARQVLEQYSKLKISPTADGITEKMVEQMTFTLDSRLSFTDIFKPVHENRFPKIWKSEITVETTNKQGWIARCMILCSRSTWLSFMKNSDDKSDKQSPNVESSAIESDSSKFHTRKNNFCPSDEEKLKLDTALRHYEITVVTGVMKGYDWDGLHEYEAQFLVFCRKDLLMLEWTEVVEKKIIPDLSLNDVSGEKKLHLKMELVNMIGKNNILNSLMNKLEVVFAEDKAYTLEYVFRIPDEVTLPEDRPNLEVDKVWTVEVANKHRQELEHNIIKLRLANELFDKEIADNLQAIELLKAVQQINSSGSFMSTDFLSNLDAGSEIFISRSSLDLFICCRNHNIGLFTLSILCFLEDESRSKFSLISSKPNQFNHFICIYAEDSILLFYSLHSITWPDTYLKRP
ncbi:BMA-ZWL-1 [Dirofilaria immitis]|nr:BMA-ZWL-1 [Dirofilaria immitis]